MFNYKEIMIYKLLKLSHVVLKIFLFLSFIKNKFLLRILYNIF